MNAKSTSYFFQSLLILSILFIPFISFSQTITLPPLSSSIIYTSTIQNNNMFLGAEGNSGMEGYTEAATLSGVQCRKIPAGKFMYIYSTRAAVPTSTNNIILSITYLDNSMNSMWINYTRSGNPNGWGGGDFQKSNTKKWITRLISLTDAGLDGSMGYSGDIRLGNGNEDNYIKDISIYIGKLDPDAQPVPAKVNNPNSEFIGKSFAGYQLWHEAGPTANDWKHWAYGKLPAAGRGNHNTEMFPIVANYEGNPNITMYSTNYANLGNGQPARLYNSTDKGVIDVQMNLLQSAGFDGVAIQRNAPVGRALKYTATDDYYVSIKNACESTGRLFYVMYCMPDVNNGDLASASLVEGIKRDWVYQMEQIYKLTSSGAYATVNGKPVVELWGLGYSTISVDKAQALELAAFFKARGCYVIAGTPRDFRLRNEGSRTDFEDVYKAYDMISPWTVGAYNDVTSADNFKTNYLIPDKAYCTTNNLAYFPVIMPGSAWSQHVTGYPNDTKRQGGKFLWQQALNIKSVGCQSMYFAMLDEFEESTNIISAAVDYFDIPTDQYFGTLSMDGIWTSSDYYLRLGGAAARMLTSGSSPTTIPIPYSNGPIYYRNSFESRVANCLINNVAQDIVSPIDPCFYNPSALSSTGINTPAVAIVNEPSFTKNGIYSAKATGSPNNATSASYYYLTSETKITVKANMQLSFWKYSANTLGQYTSVDLVFQSGKRLKDYPAYVDNNGNAMTPSIARGTVGSWEKFTCQIGTGQFIGDVITGIVIGYDHPVASGNYIAYFDDVIIEDAPVNPLAPVVSSAATAAGALSTPFSYAITASNTPTSFDATGLPAGLTVNTTSGLISGTPTTYGTYTVTISASNSNGTGTKTLTITIPAPSGQSAYLGTPWPIPGKIEAEYYDEGGEGVAYHDDEAANKFNLFRTTEGVDAEATSDALGGYNLGWTVAGEWLEYSVDVQTAGTYTIQARMASGNAGTRTIRVYMDNTDISGAISFDASLSPWSSGWQTFNTITATTPVLTTGPKIMKIAIEAGDFNLNYVNFVVAVPLGIEQQNNNNTVTPKTLSNIEVYPNPVKSGESIKTKFVNQGKGVFQVHLYNYLGQTVYHTALNVEGDLVIHTLETPQPLMPGYYHLEIISESGSRALQKIVVR